MTIANRVKDGVLDASGHFPSGAVRALSGATNFVVMGNGLCSRNLRPQRRVKFREQLFDLAVTALNGAQRPVYLEFGVYEGGSLRYMAEAIPSPDCRMFGFDSFEGLPEDWQAHAHAGVFDTGGTVPKINDRRVEFVVGWFEESLQRFEMPDHDRLIINIDSDLYSSAATVLQWLEPHLAVGDLVYFDEFDDRFHEYRAFIEFLDRSGQVFEMAAATHGMTHALFRRL